jgi:hypothetical protein
MPAWLTKYRLWGVSGQENRLASLYVEYTTHALSRRTAQVTYSTADTKRRDTQVAQLITDA